MKSVLRILFSCLTCIFIASCSEDESESYESYLKGIYSNYSDDKQSNLNVTYNGENVKDKEVLVRTMDDLTCDVEFKNIFFTPDVLFSNITLKKFGDYYLCEDDSIIENKEVHFEIKIIPAYNQNQSNKASANMILDVTESDIKR